MIRDDLIANITDPISAQRASDEKFILTSYPKRAVKYPIITVRNMGASTPEKLGIQSTLHLIEMPIEIRVWARNEIERTELAQNVINRLRSVELSLTAAGNLLDFTVNSMVPVDEVGEANVKSFVITVGYRFILGA